MKNRSIIRIQISGSRNWLSHVTNNGYCSTRIKISQRTFNHRRENGEKKNTYPSILSGIFENVSLPCSLNHSGHEQHATGPSTFFDTNVRTWRDTWWDQRSVYLVSWCSETWQNITYACDNRLVSNTWLWSQRRGLTKRWIRPLKKFLMNSALSII